MYESSTMKPTKTLKRRKGREDNLDEVNLIEV
jgi:hypothetical protein